MGQRLWSRKGSRYDPCNASTSDRMRPIIVGVGVDPNTLLLLRFNDFTDRSLYKRLVTPSGDAVTRIADASPVANGFGAYFDATGSTSSNNPYCYVATDAELDAVYNGNFTLEYWAARVATGAAEYSSFFLKGNHTGTPSPDLTYGLNGTTGALSVTRWYASGSGVTDAIGASVTDLLWHHYAIVRADATWFFYLDGVLVYSDTPAETELQTNSQPWAIAAYYNAFIDFGGNCLMDDFRISRVARYFGDFTPPGPHKR